MNAKIDYRELFTDKLLNYDTVQLDIYEEGYSNREWYFFTTLQFLCQASNRVGRQSAHCRALYLSWCFYLHIYK